MKNILKISLSFFALMLLATSCKKDNNNEPVPIVIDYDTVPYTFTVDIIPMQDKVEGVKLKTAFAPGDKIQITNPHVLYEPLIIPVDGHEGKTSATFSGQMKIKKDLDISSGFALTAALRNGADYNNGKLLSDVKKFNSLAEGIKKYSCWSCEDVAFNNNAASFSLTQSTVFVQFDIVSVQMLLTLGKAFENVVVSGNTGLALTAGTTAKIAALDFEQTFGKDGKLFYKVTYTAPDKCLPGLFSVGEDKVIFFSNGNLQYRPWDDSWRLAPQQYHKCFNENKFNVGNFYECWMGEDKWTDLFWWGTWIKGYDPEFVEDLNMSFDPTTDENGELVGDCAFGEEWSVLSLDEWKYLLSERPNADQKRGGAVVDGIEGWIFLPDDWSVPEGISPFESTFDVKYDEEVPNNYTKEQWTQMESAGAVFLPAAGLLWQTFVQFDMNYYFARTSNFSPDQFYFDCLASTFDFNLGLPSSIGAPVRLIQPKVDNKRVEVE